jgi:hypothetical protein
LSEAFGKNLAPQGKRGRFPRELSFSPLLKPTIAGREPSKDRFGNYSDPQSEICFGRDALCTI